MNGMLRLRYQLKTSSIFPEIDVGGMNIVLEIIFEMRDLTEHVPLMYSFIAVIRNNYDLPEVSKPAISLRLRSLRIHVGVGDLHWGFGGHLEASEAG